MQLNHSALSHRIMAAEQALRYFDAIVGYKPHQIICGLPRFLRGLSAHQVEAQTETNPSSCASCQIADFLNLLGNLSWRLPQDR